MFIFEEIQASGILLCYGPLVLTIVGFIAFAYLTDNLSTATYLRNLDPRPEAEIKEPQTVAVKRPMQAKTPTGVPVVLVPEAAPPVATDPAPAAPKSDDLRRVEGIGPKIESVLNAAGITTFSHLAVTTPETLREILTEAGVTAVSDPTTWPEQAELAAQGKWQALEQLQEQLRGGKRV